MFPSSFEVYLWILTGSFTSRGYRCLNVEIQEPRQHWTHAFITHSVCSECTRSHLTNITSHSAKRCLFTPVGCQHSAMYWMHSENKTDLLLPSWSLQTFKKHTQEYVYNYPFWWALWRENLVREERNRGAGESSPGEFSEKASPRKVKELDMKPKFGWTSEFFLVQCMFAYLH